MVGGRKVVVVFVMSTLQKKNKIGGELVRGDRWIGKKRTLVEYVNGEGVIGSENAKPVSLEKGGKSVAK